MPKSHAVQTAILSAMAEVSQQEVARRMGVSDATVCRMKEKLERYCELIAACGLEVVPAGRKRPDAEYVRSLEDAYTRLLQARRYEEDEV